MKEELIVHPESGLIHDSEKETEELVPAKRTPDEIVVDATHKAELLKKIITTQNLFTTIGKKDHVNYEGWCICAAFFGVSIREREDQTVQMNDGSWKAYVDLVRESDGMVIGGASHICSPEEENWAQSPSYAVRSMAVTRAAGKACRLKWSWVMQLAGYSPTPTEEMLGVKQSKKQATSKSQDGTYDRTPGRKITEKQRGRFIAIGRAHGWTDEQMQQLIREYGFETTADITRDRYDDICKHVETDMHQ